MVEHPAIEAARRWIGTPYHHQGALRGVGCDCLGLLRGVWRDLYDADAEDPGAYDASRFRSGGRETLLEAAHRHLIAKASLDISPGDVLLFRLHPMRPVQHCGIAVDQTTMIHAHDGACVCEVGLAPWLRRLAFVFTFPLADERS
jgi:NlpC/P60 family putative phage cell wall peptidase